MDWSDYIAIGAAVVAVASLAWRICEWRLRQARIKVKVHEGFPTQGNRLLNPIVSITVINHGKEPIRISSIGFNHKEKGAMLDLSLLARILQDPTSALLMYCLLN